MNLLARSANSTISPIHESWARIENWLRQHLSSTLETLSPGLTDHSVQAFEKAIGQELPKDARTFLQIHNGQTRDPEIGVVYGLRLLDVFEESLEEWKFLNDNDNVATLGRHHYTSFPEGAISLEISNPGWIPICADWGGNFLALDLAPGPAGVTGQIINFGRDEYCRCVLAQSWGQFLDDYSNELEQGNFDIGLNGDFKIKFPKTGHFLDNSLAWSKAKLGC